MLKLGRKIVKFRIPIFILSLLLLIPSAIGYLNTRVNYDVLYYLPDDIETMKGQDILVDEFGTGAYSMFVCEGMEKDDIETMKGQDILVDEFGTGAYSMFVCEGMENKDVAALKKKIEKVDHVAKVVWYDSLSDISIPAEMLPEKIKKVLFADDAKVVWYDSLSDISIPAEMLPEKIKKVLFADDSTMMFIIFDTTTSADETMDAIGDIRKLAGKQCFVSGMSAIVTDTKNLAESEVAVYVLIAVVLSCIVLALTMESYLIPFLFLASIGIAIAYNMGTNVFQGEISYITKALSAVLQLGVTMDYSIFLWHSYQEQRARFGDNHKEAMAQAIAATIKSVVGSSITTIAGFIALCFMSFTLGMDLGVVMAKGVIFGVICCVTVLPSMIMIFDRALEKTKHRQLIPDFPKVPEFLVKHHKALAFLCVALFIPFAYFQANTKVYYNLDSSLPKELESIQANEKLQKDYNMGAAHMILLDNKISEKDTYKMIDEMKKVKGVKEVLGLETIIGPSFPESMIPDDIKEILKSDNYELMLITNQYQTASDEVNKQIDELNKILKKYDPAGMLVGEAPCTKDLIEITDHDFKVVSAVSILAVFLIILFVFNRQECW